MKRFVSFGVVVITLPPCANDIQWTFTLRVLVRLAGANPRIHHKLKLLSSGVSEVILGQL